jgi:WD40 repeat protein
LTALASVCAVHLPDYVADVAWRPDGELLALACADGSVHELVPAAAAGAPVGEHRGGACAVAFAPDGTLASAGEDGRVAIGVLSPRPAGAGWVERLAWSPSGSRLASAVGTRVQLWTAEGELVAESAPLPATAECIAWRPDGAWLAVGGHGGVSFLTPDGETAGQRIEWTGVVLALSWAPDGRRLACGMQDQAVWLWDVDGGRAATHDGYARKVRELAWSGDGTLLATGGGSVPVVWCFAPGGIEATGQIELRGHGKPVIWLGFQPGGPYLATGSEDGVAILWQLPNDQPLTGATVDEPLSCCAWAPDGRHIALAGERGATAIFALV